MKFALPGLIMLGALGAMSASAQFTTPTPTLPPQGDTFLLHNPPITFGGVLVEGLGVYDFEMLALSLTSASAGIIPPEDPGVGTPWSVTLEGSVSVVVVGLGALNVPLTGTASGTTTLREPPTPGVAYYDTKMSQLELFDAGGVGVEIRESPTKQSLGVVSSTDVGAGLYRIDSFFDVFTELSMDSGISWIEASGSAHLANSPASGEVPEPGTWAVGAAVAGLGLLAWRRRAVNAPVA